MNNNTKKSLMNFITNFKNKYQHNTIMNTLLVIFICYIQYISLDFSCILAFEPLKVTILWAITTFSLFFLTMIMILITRKTRTSCIIMSILVLLLSITNLLVYKFHGMPFVFADLKNIGTAFNSIKGGSISAFFFQPRYLLFLLCFFFELMLCFFFEKKHTFKINKSILLLLFCSIGIYYSYFSPNPLVPENALSAIPYDTISRYSYFPALIRQLLLSLKSPIYEQHNFNKDKVLSFMKEYDNDLFFDRYYKLLNIDLSKNHNSEKDFVENTTTQSYPDILLILNESYFNLNELIDIDISNNYFEQFHNINDTLTGYTVVPGTNGGTNVSEWELLTNNSYLLCNSITPFNSLEMKNANSVVQYLKSLGYSTLACHPQSGHNYRRIFKWKDLGFDKIYFEDDFQNLTYWANRKNTPTDESTYNNLIKWFEKMDDAAPKFAFCVTMQNHPLYEDNASSQNFIKSYTSFNKNQSEVEEYLSCMYLSKNAINKLINHFSSYERDIIIVILGDHAPAISIQNQNEEETNSLYLKQKSTPFIFWSNNTEILTRFYNIPLVMNEKRIGLIYLMPTVLESANIPLSKYYNYLINMRNIIPVLSIGNCFYDANGNTHYYQSKTQFEEVLNQYFNIEYLNISYPEDFKNFYLP